MHRPSLRGVLLFERSRWHVCAGTSLAGKEGMVQVLRGESFMMPSGKMMVVWSVLILGPVIAEYAKCAA